MEISFCELQKSVELYPEISPFSVESLKHFILPFLENPDEEYKRLGNALQYRAFLCPLYTNN